MLNYNNYKNGRHHRYYGGYVKKSPYRIIVPNSGHWYITIDLGGYSGTVKHSVQVLPGVYRLQGYEYLLQMSLIYM